jgi:hypothetical protein
VFVQVTGIFLPGHPQILRHVGFTHDAATGRP